jgi:hypothetical protein
LTRCSRGLDRNDIGTRADFGDRVYCDLPDVSPPETPGSESSHARGAVRLLPRWRRAASEGGRRSRAADFSTTQDYLLCTACENLLNRGGEAWLNPKFATIERKFPFYDLLVQVSPEEEEDRFRVYFAQKIPAIKIEKLAHFALGIFWKASVHSWSGRSIEPRIELGPYGEAIRKWLIGESEFPENITLSVIVSPPERAQRVFTEPTCGIPEPGWRTYFIHVLGVIFALNVGKQIPSEVKELCVYRNLNHPITVSDDFTSDMQTAFSSMLREARKTKAYFEAKRKRHAGK